MKKELTLEITEMILTIILVCWLVYVKTEIWQVFTVSLLVWIYWEVHFIRRNLS